MSIEINTTEAQKENIIDDISEQSLDEDKLAKLKAKLAAKKDAEKKETEMAPTKKDKSINFGVIGSGQAGSRISESYYKLGYDAVAINTAQQDLKFIDIPESNKLHLEYGLGGAGKSLAFGYEAASEYREQILNLVNTQLADAQAFIFAFSAGGGSGGGSCDVIIDVLTELQKPIVVITTLPMESDDAQTKQNTLETLGKLTKYLQAKAISNLFVIDNAKLELIYDKVGQMDFFNVANAAIVSPIVAFNNLSATPSSYKALDPTEFSKLMLDGEGISIYSEMKISNYDDETAIAEAVVSNLDSSLLASGFDISEAKYVGFIVAANKDVWKNIPSSSINYALAVVNDVCKSPLAVFKGVYTIDTPSNEILVYTMLSGLSLPKSRIDALVIQSKELAANAKSKDAARNLNLGLNTGVNETISAAQKVKDKMAAKSSVFSKFQNKIVDRRKG